AVVLLSGGMDSAVSLWWTKKKGFECHALAFDYGQRHKKELKNARTLAHLAHVPIEIVKLRLPWSQSSLTNERSALPHHRLSQISRGEIPSTYVPGRNTLFLSFALSKADQLKAEVLVIGANAIDYSGYPDCRPQYLKAFERVANLGSKMGSEDRRNIR